MKFTSFEEEIEYSQKRFKLKNEIEKLFIEKNYMNYETNIIVRHQTESINKAGNNTKNAVKLVEENGNVSMLTKDITTNLLNKLIPNWTPGLKAKIFYYGKTFNKENNKIKERRQMGAECIGIETIDADKEIINLLISIISKYRDKFILEIGTSEYLKGLLNEFYLDDVDYNTIIDLINKKNKEDLKEYLKKFEDTSFKESLTNIIDLRGDIETVLNKIKDYDVNEKIEKGIEELREIKDYLAKFNINKENIICDLSMTSSLNYYSGLMFKAFYENSNQEIIKGGRYDIDMGEYGGIIPAIGFSIEIDELLSNISRKEEIR